MKKSVKFCPELRERAVRMVTECRADHPSLWSAVESIAAKIGCTSQTLLTWVRPTILIIEIASYVSQISFGNF
jgi:transposase-like protein